MTSQTELHNKLAGDVVKTIVKTPLEAGGQMSDALVILESVVLGVVLVATKYGYPEDVTLDELTKHVRERLDELRLAAVKTLGSA